MTGLAEGDPRHGTTNGYTNLGCRCQPCRDAWAAMQARNRVDRAARAAAGDPTVPHGRYTTYGNYNCRCAACVDAFRRHRGSVPGFRTARSDHHLPDYTPRRQHILRWIYNNGTETKRALTGWGFRTVDHPARRRGQKGWSASALDAIHPDGTVRDPT